MLQRRSDIIPAILAATGVLVLILDRQGRIVRVNDACERTIGYRLEETRGKPVWELLLSPEDRDRVRDAFLEPREHDFPTEYEHRWVARDGAQRRIAWSVTPVSDRRGAVEYLVCFGFDITERERIEEALRESEEQFRILFERAPLAYQSLDGQGCFIDVNGAWLALLGYAKEEVIGRSFAEFITPAYQERFRESFGRFGVAGQMHGAEFEMVPMEGPPIVVSANGSIAYDEKGRFKQTHCILYDITARKKAEAAEREQRVLAEALCEAATALNSTLSCNEVMDRILDCADNVVPHDASSIACVESGIARIVRCRGYDGHGLDRPSLPRCVPLDGLPALRPVLETGRPSVVDDTETCPGWVEPPETRWVRSRLNVPLGTKGQMACFISLASATPGFFTSTHAASLHAFAHQAAIALENARLSEQVNAARERMRRLSQQAVTAHEEERRRLSHELHDEAGQAMTALRIGLRLIQADLPTGSEALQRRVSEAVELTEVTMERLRVLARDLRPPALDEAGLCVSLEDLCRDFARRTHLSIDFHRAELPILSAEASICLYRFVQEALTNVAKHAAANRVSVTLRSEGGAIRVEVEDDGRGFQRETCTCGIPDTMGIGLTGMQERLAMLGGWLEIQSHPGHGTRLLAHVPLRGDS